MRFATSGLLVMSLLAFGCDDDKKDVEIIEYEGDIEAKSGSDLTGTVTLTSEDGVVTVKVQVADVTPGEHGVHLHVTPDCSDDVAMNAGGHWNPGAATHGAPTGPSHSGDLGNMTVGADGKGTLTISKPEWKLEDGSAYDLLGHALVVHGGKDDLMTDPAGNSGARIGCVAFEE